MKKRLIRMAAWVMVLVLSFTLPVSAAPISTGSDVMEALDKLFTATDNLTFQGKATFFLDGKPYESLEVSQLVDGLKQFRQSTVTIPEDFLQAYESRERTAARYMDGAKSYNYYDGIMSADFTLGAPRQGMLKLGEYEKVLMALGKAVVSPLLEGKLLQTEGKLAFSLTAQDVPAMFNSLVTFVIMSWYVRNGFDPDQDPVDRGPEVEFESYSDSLQHYARAELGLPEVLVEAFHSSTVTLTEEGQKAHNDAAVAFYEWMHSMLSQRNSGVLYIRKDNTFAWYDTREELMRREHVMYFDYPDLETMFKLVFPDEPFPYGAEDEYDYRDPVLVERFVTHFRQQDPNVVGARVMKNNTVVTYTSALAYAVGSYSVVERIPLSIRQFHVKKLEGMLAYDDLGRITSMEADLEAEIQDLLGETHMLQLKGDFQVTEYGTTQVTLPEATETSKG